MLSVSHTIGKLKYKEEIKQDFRNLSYFDSILIPTQIGDINMITITYNTKVNNKNNTKQVVRKLRHLGTFVVVSIVSAVCKVIEYELKRCTISTQCSQPKQHNG